MSRVTTPLLSLGTWARGDKPGAGSQTDESGTGLNFNWIRIDTALGTQHNTDGTHKASVITGTNLNTNVVDADTVLYDGATKKIKLGTVHGANLDAAIVDSVGIEINANILRLKAAGVHKGNINADVVDASTVILDANGKIAVGPNAALVRYQAYDEIRVAGTSAGNTPAAAGTWVEISYVAYVAKFQFMHRKRPGDQKILFSAFVKTDNAARPWFVELKNFAIAVVATGTNTVDDFLVAANCQLSLDISSEIDNINYEITVSMKTTSPGTVTLVRPSIMVTT